MQILIVFKVLGPIDILLHCLFILPLVTKTGFLLAKFSDISFNFFAVENLL